MDITIDYFSAKLFIAKGCQFLFNYTLLSLWAVHKKFVINKLCERIYVFNFYPNNQP